MKKHGNLKKLNSISKKTRNLLEYLLEFPLGFLFLFSNKSKNNQQ